MVATLTLAGCGKNDDNGGLSIEEGTVPTKIVDRGPDGKLRSEVFQNIQGGKILSTSIKNYKEDGTTYSESLVTVNYDGDYPKSSTLTFSIKGDLRYDRNYTETYDYDNGKLKSTSQKYTDMEMPVVTTYNYSGNDLSQKIVETPQRDTNGRLVNISVREDNYHRDGNRVTVTEIAYDKELSGNIVESSRRQSVSIYTLENENIVKIESGDGSNVTEYTYDDKNNPELKNLFKLMTPEYFVKIDLSKNNILKEIEVRNGNRSTREEYEYTYNDKGYPTTKKRFRIRNTNGVESKELTGQTEYTY